MSAPPPDPFFEQRIRERIEQIERQRDLARAQQQAAGLNSMIGSGLYGGSAQQNVAGAPNMAMPGLHPLPPSPMSDHQRRMNDMVSRDPQMKETLHALCSLLGYEIQSMILNPPLGMSPVDGGIAWRVVSRKWSLYTTWIDTEAPSFGAFKLHFAKLSDAIAERREKLIKEGKPMPLEPAEPETVLQQQMEVLRRYAQQASQQGFGHVFDQRAMQNMALKMAKMSGASAQPAPLLGEGQAKAFWGSGC